MNGLGFVAFSLSYRLYKKSNVTRPARSKLSLVDCPRDTLRFAPRVDQPRYRNFLNPSPIDVRSIPITVSVKNLYIQIVSFTWEQADIPNFCMAKQLKIKYFCFSDFWFVRKILRKSCFYCSLEMRMQNEKHSNFMKLF